MSPHGWIALAILLAAATLFLTRRLPLEATAIAVPLLLWVTGTVPDAQQALSGFGNPAVIALACVFVLGGAMQESGVAELMARLLARAGGGELRLVAVVCVASAALSAFMFNAGVVAIMLPGVLALSRRARVPASRLLMPMAFATILGGNLTLIGAAPNVLASELLEATTGRGFAMFDFTPLGAALAAAGIAFLVLIGRRLLPAALPGDRLSRGGLPARLAREYGLAANLTRLRVTSNSRLCGRTLADLELGQRYDIVVVLLGRHSGLGLHWHVPTGDLCLQPGDDLYLEGDTEELWRLAEEQQTRIGLTGQHHVEAVLDQGIRLGEVLVGPRSGARGKTLRELEFRRTYRVSVLTLWRGDDKLAKGVSTTPLKVGDTLLVAGSERALRRLGESDDFALLAGDLSGRDVRKAPLALLLLGAALLPPAFGWAPLAISTLAAALLAVLSGCVNMRAAAHAIEWPVLALVVGTLPLGHALAEHGVAAAAAKLLLQLADGHGAVLVFGVLFGAASLVSITLNNAAAAVILAPVATRAALELGLSPGVALLAVTSGCSCAFLVPFAHQCNLMVATPGGYSTRDFLKVGSLLTLVVAGLAIALLPSLTL